MVFLSQLAALLQPAHEPRDSACASNARNARPSGGGAREDQEVRERKQLFRRRSSACCHTCRCNTSSPRSGTVVERAFQAPTLAGSSQEGGGGGSSSHAAVVSKLAAALTLNIPKELFWKRDFKSERGRRCQGEKRAARGKGGSLSRR